jgi:hypothetical protein
MLPLIVSFYFIAVSGGGEGEEEEEDPAVSMVLRVGRGQAFGGRVKSLVLVAG